MHVHEPGYHQATPSVDFSHGQLRCAEVAAFAADPDDDAADREHVRAPDALRRVDLAAAEQRQHAASTISAGCPSAATRSSSSTIPAARLPVRTTPTRWADSRKAAAASSARISGAS